MQIYLENLSFIYEHLVSSGADDGESWKQGENDGRSIRRMGYEPAPLTGPFENVWGFFERYGHDYAAHVVFKAKTSDVFDGVSDRFGKSLSDGLLWKPTAKNCFGYILNGDKKPRMGVSDFRNEGTYRKICFGAAGSTPRPIINNEETISIGEFTRQVKELEGVANLFVAACGLEMDYSIFLTL